MTKTTAKELNAQLPASQKPMSMYTAAALTPIRFCIHDFMKSTVNSKPSIMAPLITNSSTSIVVPNFSATPQDTGRDKNMAVSSPMSSLTKRYAALSMVLILSSVRASLLDLCVDDETISCTTSPAPSTTSLIASPTTSPTRLLLVCFIVDAARSTTLAPILENLEREINEPPSSMAKASATFAVNEVVLDGALVSNMRTRLGNFSEQLILRLV
mmetsp:Transcript_3654/g.7715  ORF Transcript_3654/g.7715 Transcript_3654/m.7715 type:complete len:214 (+) Transcript_3654:75-716(+)